MTITREDFNSFFGTKITEDDWKANADFVCEEYDTSKDFEINVGLDFDECAENDTAAYHGGTHKYIFFAQVNYDWESNRIIAWE